MRYIDPYQLGMAVQESMYKNPHDDPKIARNHRLEHEHFLRLIALAPDADVEPVVHGRWDRNGYCSVCDFWTCYCGDYHYCPNCGAKMDVEGT